MHHRTSQDGRNYVMYEVIGPNNVAVPTHFFKILLVETRAGEFELECYLMPNRPMNENLPLQSFQVPLDSIERSSGLLFFEKLPKQKLKSINGPNRFLTKFDQPGKKN
jgi:endonuclease G